MATAESTGEEKSMEHNQKLTELARKLRKNMTLEERTLWYHFLKNHSFSFRRQTVIGNYIVDFFCYQAKLVIELDGSQHYEQTGLDNDKKRTEYLKQQGLTVIRFSNDDVKHNLRGVCEKINDVLENLNHSKE
ncbi:MAG: DUF559 domain-containing protein [Eubacteriales bacterium]|nr:DUF559 domain-containing protein [Eubacteriales bacterium]